MNRYVLPILLTALIIAVPAFGSETDTWKIGGYFDVGAADALWSDHSYLHGGIDLTCSSEFSLSIPLTYVTSDTGRSLVDTSIMLTYHPGGSSFWIGVSLFQGIRLQGEDRPADWYHYMQEAAAGYRVVLPCGFYLEPSLVIRDPGGMFHESLELISAYVSGYDRLRLCLQLGWTGLRIDL